MLENKIGIVTGGASGLGEAAVRRLASEGASVVIADVDRDRGERVAAELRDAGGKVAFVEADVTSEKEVAHMVDFTLETFGGLNYAVNNAGYGHGVTKLHEIDVVTFDDQVAVNLRGTFLCTRAEVIHMKENGGGSIVNVASIAGVKGVAGTAAYGAAKHGVVGLSRATALDYVRDGIRVNVVAPGAFLTPLMQSRPQEMQQHWADLMPCGRLGDPKELANAVVWLVSDESSYVSGITMSVDFAAHQA